MGLEFHCVDAFSDAPYQGAPILVFPRAEGLVEAQMRRIAREFGYEDTVFLQRDGASLHWQMHLFGRR
ncbi:MAG: PhzF family phenazine biosynthesis protein, partial [Candidatus Macondimonas sp.]